MCAIYFLKTQSPCVSSIGILGSGLNKLTCHRLFHYASAHMNKIYWAQFQGAIVGISTIEIRKPLIVGLSLNLSEFLRAV